MENRKKQIQLIEYLDKSYQIKEGKFFTNYNDVHEWGQDIVKSLTIMFSFDLLFCEHEFSKWAYAEGITDKQWEEAYQPHILKVMWSPSVDYPSVDNAEETLISVLSEKISMEINDKILLDLRSKIKTSNDFLNLVKCIGYEPSITIFDPQTFRPMKRFISMKHNDIINERKNNTLWQNWVKNHPS